MDNCGFHHRHFVEPLLTTMLNKYGIHPLFQTPVFSTPKYMRTNCFHQVKCFLRRNQLLAQHETEIAIFDARSEISAKTSAAYFRHCGYL